MKPPAIGSKAGNVLAAVAAGCTTHESVGKHCGISTTLANAHLKILLDGGHVTRTGERGSFRYALPPPAEMQVKGPTSGPMDARQR